MRSELDGVTRPPTQVLDSGLGRLGRWCYDRRRMVVVLWIAGLIVLTIVAQAVTGQFSDRFGSGHSESDRVQTLLQQQFPTRAGDNGDVVFQTAQPVTSPASQAAVARVIGQLQPLPHVSAVRSPPASGPWGAAGRWPPGPGAAAAATASPGTTTSPGRGPSASSPATRRSE